MIITRAWCLSRDTGPSAAKDGADCQPLRTYLADLVRPFGFRLREDLLSAGISYGEMGVELLGSGLADVEPAELLVLAFAVPDSAPWGSAASRLSSRCPGAPLAFAVCDQGTVAGFGGLRLIGSCLGAGQRAVLVVAEQSAVGYELPAATPAPASDAMVALLCEQAGPGSRARVRLYADVPAGRVPALLAAALRELGEATLVAGNGLAADGLTAGVGQFVSAPGGQPLTGVWWAAAGLLGSGPLLLANYDPLLRSLALCAIAP